MAQAEENKDQQAATGVQEAEFAEADENTVATDEPNLDILLDINMPITVCIGKTEITFKELLQLGPQAVLPLDKPVGQPAELYVQDIRFATGDIVVVDGCFAVRIQEILGMENLEETAQEVAAQEAE